MENQELLPHEINEEMSYESKAEFEPSPSGFHERLKNLLIFLKPSKSGFRPLQQPGRNSRGWSWLLYLLVAAVGFMIGLIGNAVAGSPFQFSRGIVNLGSCGSTPEEIQQNGCVFDLILGAWIDPRCHDQELYEKYVPWLQGLNMTWFSDKDGLHEISFNDALTGNYLPVWTGGSHHYLHCTYFWERQWKAAKYSRKAIDSETRSDEHTMHCIDHNGRPMVEEMLGPQNLLRVNSPVECLIG